MYQLVRRAREVLWLGSIAVWLFYGALVNSWAGHRPLTPDLAHPFKFKNHGVMFVSRSDLALSHVLLAMIVGLVASALAAYALELRWPAGRAAQAVARAESDRAWRRKLEKRALKNYRNGR